MKKFLALALCMAGLSRSAEPEVRLPASVQKLDLASAEGIAVLAGGRVKPLLVAATEGVQEIRGRAGLTRELGPMRSWFALALHGESLSGQKIIYCPNKTLRKEIGLDPQGQFASFDELASNVKLQALAESADEKDRSRLRPTPLERAARETRRRMEKFLDARAGATWRLLPGPAGLEGEWRLPQEVPVHEIAVNPALVGRVEAVRNMFAAFATGNQALFDSSARALSENDLLTDSLSGLGNGQFLRTRPAHVEAELALAKFHPFRWAWIALLVSFLAAWISRSTADTSPPKSRAALVASAGAMGLAAVFLLAGFALRVFVSGRAPVTNMYETTLWVGFGVVLFGGPLSWIYRSRALLASVAAAGCVVFVLADNLPTVLDPSIKPLVPVLRSNFWLSLHVLTITISYAAFLLAMAVGNLGIAQVFRKDSEPFQKTLAHYAYRSMQLGLLLLVAGIVLGGVWADYSWGRFWGWDPKETWSLIAALGYLIVLHGRFSGWIGVFGTLMGGVLAFFGVVMAWYGVNFILASGLHSYGFSEGGTAAMGAFVAIQGAFAAACAARHRKANPQR